MIARATTQDRGTPMPLGQKLWREVARPFSRLSRRPARHGGGAHPEQPPAPKVSDLRGFSPCQATVEEEAIPLLRRLVRASSRHGGPIIEIGTLLGITTTTIALAKDPCQKVITVDNFGWNPWGIPSQAHQAMAGQVLRYLVETGHVRQVTMDKNRFFETYDGPSPSMVFLDAIHDYEETKKDIVWARLVGAEIISGHDYCEKFPGVMEVVDEFGGPRELLGSVWML